MVVKMRLEDLRCNEAQDLKYRDNGLLELQAPSQSPLLDLGRGDGT